MNLSLLKAVYLKYFATNFSLSNADFQSYPPNHYVLKTISKTKSTISTNSTINLLSFSLKKQKKKINDKRPNFKYFTFILLEEAWINELFLIMIIEIIHLLHICLEHELDSFFHFVCELIEHNMYLFNKLLNFFFLVVSKSIRNQIIILFLYFLQKFFYFLGLVYIMRRKLTEMLMPTLKAE